MRSRFIKAYTLVEMLVALAVSAIIIGATYASYEMVATQYHKNMDIADMHTSGRAIMRIIERDVRMAGFEYRDKDAKITYGSISNPITIKDSGNKCCDEVTVIYDYFDEDTKKAERLRIRYWAEPHTSNKGSRHRLYKQKDILGQNKKILAKPILGTKEVMADYIEDLQLINVISGGTLYIADSSYGAIASYILGANRSAMSFGISRYMNSIAYDDRPNKERLYVGYSNRKTIQVRELRDKDGDKLINSVHVLHTIYNLPFYVNSVAFNNGLVYACSTYGDVAIYNADTAKKVNTTTFNNSRCEDIVFNNNLMYVANGDIKVFDKLTGSLLNTINPSVGAFRLAFDKAKEYLYVSGVNNFIEKINLSTGKSSFITIKGGTNDIEIGPDGMLYVAPTYAPHWKIGVYNPVTGKKEKTINGKNFKRARLAFRSEYSGTESLVTINLTLRTKNQYGKDRQFKKQDYHGGNFKIDITDKYKRDTFSSTVLVRNLAL